jgi:exopolyphosphatase/pppGpp-phosphohydrolase
MRSAAAAIAPSRSTSAATGNHARCCRAHETGRSFRLGVLRLAERFAKHDPLSGADEDRLERHIRRETAGFTAQIRRRGFQRVIGTSGTILSLGALAIGARASQIGDGRRVIVRAGDIRRLRRKLVDLPLEDRGHVRARPAPRRPRAGRRRPLDTLLDRLGPPN